MFEPNFQTLFMLISFLAALISIALIVILLPRRRDPAAGALSLLMGAIVLWAFCYGMELMTTGLDGKLMWVRVEYLGVSWIGVLFLRFAMFLSGKHTWLSGMKNWGLLAVPVLTIIGVFTNDHHQLFWHRAWLETIGSNSVIVYDRGLGFWGFLVFSYTTLLVATLILLHSCLASGAFERKTFILLMAGVAAPWAGNFIYLSGVEPFSYLDLTPMAFALSGSIFFWCVLRHQILELIPIARDAVIESMQDAVFVLNPKDQVIDLNSIARELVHGPKQAVIGKPLEALFPRLFHVLETCRHDGNDSTEIKTTSNAETRFWRMRHGMLSVGDQRLGGWLITLQDITEQRRNEMAQRESEEKFRSISANALDGIVMIDPAGRVSFWNRAAEDIFGYRKDEIMGKDLHTRLAPPQFLERYRQAFIDYQQTGKGLVMGKTIEIQCIRKNGDLFPAELSLSPLLLNGQWHAIGIVRDIGQRKKTQEYLIQSEKMLSIGGLAAGMAHEINNPLAGILSNVQMLRMRLSSDLPANQQAAGECGLDLNALRQYMHKRSIGEMIEAMDQSCQRAAAIVQNMLSFSRKSDMVFTDHDLGQLLEQTVALAKNDFDLKHHHDFRQIEIVRDVDPGMPQVPCDGSQIQQVLLNILKNGAHAIWERTDRDQPPRIVLRVYVDSPYACIDISDNGIGIPDEAKQRIFEPFYTTKPAGSGTGLGLSIAYFIVTEKHGGILSADAMPGGGTTFTVKLPLQHVA